MMSLKGNFQTTKTTKWVFGIVICGLLAPNVHAESKSKQEQYQAKAVVSLSQLGQFSERDANSREADFAPASNEIKIPTKDGLITFHVSPYELKDKNAIITRSDGDAVTPVSVARQSKFFQGTSENGPGQDFAQIVLSTNSPFNQPELSGMIRVRGAYYELSAQPSSDRSGVVETNNAGDFNVIVKELSSKQTKKLRNDVLKLNHQHDDTRNLRADDESPVSAALNPADGQPGRDYVVEMTVGFEFDRTVSGYFGGDSSRIDAEAMRLLNYANGIFRTDLGIQLKLGHVNYWWWPTGNSAPVNYPYCKTGDNCGYDAYSMLSKFTNHWESVFSSRNTYPRDAAFLYSHEWSTSGTAGLAFRNSICTFGGSAAYSIGANRSGAGINETFAHELAHTVGADHAPTGVMGSGGNYFTAANQTQVWTLISKSQYNSCLQADFTLPPPGRFPKSSLPWRTGAFKNKVVLNWIINEGAGQNPVSFNIYRWRKNSGLPWNSPVCSGELIAENVPIKGKAKKYKYIDTFNLQEGTTYNYHVQSVAADGTRSYCFDYGWGYILPAAPVFVTQPVGQIVQGGQQVTLTATVTGSYLRYQWYRNNKKFGSESNDPTLIFSATAADNQAKFKLVAFNPGGKTTSNTIVLTVN